MKTIDDLLNCFCFFAIMFGVVVVGLIILEYLIKTIWPGTRGYFDDAKGCIKEARGGSLYRLVSLQLVATGEPWHLFFRGVVYAGKREWPARSSVGTTAPYVCSVFFNVVLCLFFTGASILFYTFAEGRKKSVGSGVQGEYKAALSGNVEETNAMMHFNQAKLDEFNNRNDREETHPVWHMRNWPGTSVKEAGEIERRVWEEEGWDMRGPAGPRLTWAKQYLRRAQIEYNHEVNWSETYKENLRKQGIRTEVYHEPTW